MLTAKQIRKIQQHRLSQETPLPPTREKEKHRKKKRVRLHLAYITDIRGNLRIEKR